MSTSSYIRELLLDAAANGDPRAEDALESMEGWKEDIQTALAALSEAVTDVNYVIDKLP